METPIEMNETENSPSCERASELIAFLYDEATEQEAHDFQLHLKECSECRQELASFGFLRQSITAWRNEALSGFVAAGTHVGRKSATAALRQFFDLSPLWLKGATAFAAVSLFVLAGLALVQLRSPDRPLSATPLNPKAIYTQQDVDRIVRGTLAKQEITTRPVETPEIVKLPKRSSSRSGGRTQVAKSRRPLSRAEREQLAADLRLLSTEDDLRLNLLGDRINQ